MTFSRPWWWILLLVLGFAAVFGLRLRNELFTTQYATSLSVSGDAEGAIKEYTKYLTKFPEDASAYFGRGQNYMKLNQIDLAIADFSEALQRRPQSSFSRSARASAYYAKMDYDNAIADLTIEIGEDDNMGMYYRRGLAYQRAGRFEAAQADFEKFLSRSPNYTYKYVVKARDCARQKSNDGECRALPEFPDPAAVQMLDKLGQCQFQHNCN